MSIDSVVLSEEQQLELSRIAQFRSLPAGYVFRARLILMLAEGASFSMIKQRLGTTAPTIIRWKQRFVAAGLDGLDTSHPGQSGQSAHYERSPAFAVEAGRGAGALPPHPQDLAL